MDNYRSTAIERSTLTFCVEGLSAREELLFKAFVRLLDHLTHQHWSYQPPAAHQRIDLLVVADGVEPTYSKVPNSQLQPVLRLGSAAADGRGYLSWPLKSNALENELNRLGALTTSQRGVLHGQVLFSRADTGTPLATGDTTKDLMRLQKWPPSRLLAGNGRMRLATLLTGKAMSLGELVTRSSLPLPVCKAFVDELQSAQLLLSVGITPTQSATQTPLLKPEPALQPKTTLPNLVQPGLLDRIRLRLGIKSPSRL